LLREKAGRPEEDLKKLAAHNKKMLQEIFHFNLDRYSEITIKNLVEYFGGISAKFSDEQLELALRLAYQVRNKTSPEDGLMFAEMILILFDVPVPDRIGYDSCSTGILKPYRQKVEDAIYAGQILSLRLTFESKQLTSVFPAVIVTKRQQCYDEQPVEVIFNGCNDNYRLEALKKLGLIGKIRTDGTLDRL